MLAPVGIRFRIRRRRSPRPGRIGPITARPATQTMARATRQWVSIHIRPAPDMRLPETQQMSDGELFYIMQNGIRLSAMPAWGGGSDQDAADSWKLVHFIRHLPQLTAAEKKEMEKLNPKSPDELKEEEGEEERFLKGEDINDHPIKHHER